MEIETHKKQFRGWFIPADIVVLFEEGKINSNDMVLLSTVDSLIRCSDGKGCFASNKYLAKKTHTSEEMVTRRLTKLKRIGLVQQVAFDGRKRFLQTCWSRSVPDVSEQTPTKGSSRTPTKGSSRTPTKGSSRTPRKGPSILNKLNSKNKSPRTADDTPRLNISEDDEDWCIEQGAHLRSTLVKYNVDLLAPKNGRCPVSLKTLTNCIKQLRYSRGVSKDEIIELLNWLEDHYNDQFVPKIRKANDLYTNWKRFVEAKQNIDFDRNREEEDDDYVLMPDEDGDLVKVRSSIAFRVGE